MRAITVICSTILTALLAACVTAPTPPVNSPAFVKRAPLPGQPGYLATIRYIYGGMRYMTSDAAFFVSSGGEMCFQGLSDTTMNPYAVRKNYWCMSPLAVGAVDRVENNVTYINGVRLWCRVTAPQCAHKFGWPNPMDELWEANSLVVDTTPSRGQQAAFEHLIYLMGGDLGPTAAPAWGGSPAAYDPPR